jgi:predicted O-methyltransferase YrrM
MSSEDTRVRAPSDSPDRGVAGDRYERLKDAYESLERRHADLQDGYYLSGSGKKIDIARLPGFADIAARVRADGRAGMHLDRLYTLWQALQHAPAGLPIVEVGAYLGGSARFIAETCRLRGQEPRFYVCDTFAGHARTDAAFDLATHRDGRKFVNTSPETVAEYLAPFPNVQLVVGDILDTAPRVLGGESSFGFVHVDVDVYPPTDFCLRFFAPRLAPGALLVVDDYGFTTCPGAKKAVDDFVAAQPEFSMLHLLTGQAIVFRGR